MILGKKTNENDEINHYVNLFDEFDESLMEFIGGQPMKYTNGYEDEIFDYKMLIEFLGKNIIAEEEKTNKIIDDAWNEEIDLRYDYSHVKRFREFTLHSTFLSIYSMYEGRLREYCNILQHFNKAVINLRSDDDPAQVMTRIAGILHIKNDSKGDRSLCVDLRHVIIHQKCYLNSKDSKDKGRIDKIKQNRFLKLTACNVGRYDYKVHITKSLYLLNFLDLIFRDLAKISSTSQKTLTL